MSFLFDKVKDAVSDVEKRFQGKEHGQSHEHSGQGPQVAQQQQQQQQRRTGKHTHLHTHHSGVCSDGDNHHNHRFQSFAPQREGNDAKWYVDGCSYMWAVSEALEHAQTSIWILDWWLSPELYLRRPPAKNEQYRIDK
ncbi:hypothetical protein KC336_g18152, partial [Hortaea werneckii]